MNVDLVWRTWVGVIGKSEIDIACNKCKYNSECNFKGECIDSECRCRNENGAQNLGTHCEVSLRDDCRTIVGGECVALS